MFEKADLIHSYTRAEAIADGVLIDVSATAREAGFKYPVALTAAVSGLASGWMVTVPRVPAAGRARAGRSRRLAVGMELPLAEQPCRP